MLGSFHVNVKFSGLVVIKNTNFEDCGPSFSLGAMQLTNLILEYFRQIPCKSEIF
jgi:hypothetical protein